MMGGVGCDGWIHRDGKGGEEVTGVTLHAMVKTRAHSVDDGPMGFCFPIVIVEFIAGSVSDEKPGDVLLERARAVLVEDIWEVLFGVVVA